MNLVLVHGLYGFSCCIFVFEFNHPEKNMHNQSHDIRVLSLGFLTAHLPFQSYSSIVDRVCGVLYLFLWKTAKQD